MIDSVSFHPAVVQWFAGSFAQPSPPQTQGWPAIAAGKHTLILAPTGSGKTLAAFLWCIDDLLRRGLQTEPDEFARNATGVHTLYISPLKALNNDIQRNLTEPLHGIRHAAIALNLTPPAIRVLVRTGDTPTPLRQSMLKRPPHILITTPESLYLLLTSPRGRDIFRNLHYIIVDEIHALCNNKRGVHLSLSLERLLVLCYEEPVRIGLSATQRPLSRVAAFLGGQYVNLQTGRVAVRDVTIVDCGQRREMNLQVISPTADFGNLPEVTIWPAVYEKLYDLIRAHRTTLVFVNMRAQAEKIARELNDLHRQYTGDPAAEIALAHHGSLSREARQETESRLKAGKIPTIIATASLELGIDIGSIELVVQLESPRSITSALQRVGRSGHLLHATSKGRIIPLYSADLDDSVAMAAAMQRGEVEETMIPESCLDVLSQQVTAEVAMREWQRLELFHLVQRSYCYRNLPLSVFDRVLHLLSGHYANLPLQTLRPRLIWDKVNDRLLPHRNARLQAILNSGTIPDRGYYGVYLADSNIKLGEMEEEFVFESRVGEVFFLGNNEWLIQDITHDRLVVTSARSTKPKPPFWKGDILYRDFSTQIQIGACRRGWAEQTSAKKDGTAWLQQFSPADSVITANLHSYLNRQRVHTGELPTDKLVVMESFRDTANEPQLILHAPFGARVNGAWAITLASLIEKRYRIQVQYEYNDDGIILRQLDTPELLAVEELIKLSADDTEKLLLDALVNTPLFAIRFRYNAMRALLLPRSTPGKRIPLWLQRLRAADLLQLVRHHRDFPIIIETYRECLHDIFDLNSLHLVLKRLQSGEIRVHTVETSSPSPMAAGLLFRFTASNFYETDRARFTGQAAEISSELLTEVLARDQIPQVVTPEIVATAEAHWQHLSDQSKAVDQEDLFAIIEKFGPINDEALHLRAKADPGTWIEQLQREQRITRLTGYFSGWISAEEVEYFLSIPSAGTVVDTGQQPAVEIRPETVRLLVQKYLQSHGPFTLSQLAAALNLPPEVLLPHLTGLQQQQAVVVGNLVLGITLPQWCERNNFTELYRRAIAARRQVTTIANRQSYYEFLLKWHQMAEPRQSLAELVQRYSGCKFPLYFFEREILRSRFAVQDTAAMSALLAEFDDLVARGEVIARASSADEESRPLLEFFPRGEGHIFFSKADLLAAAERLSDSAKTLFVFLQENGASLLRDVEAGSDLTANQIEEGLMVLVRAGLASSDYYPAFLGVLQRQSSAQSQQAAKVFGPSELVMPSRNRSHLSRSAIRQRVQEQTRRRGGRWFLTTSFGVLGKEAHNAGDGVQSMLAEEKSRVLPQARLLALRHGILVKECYRQERRLLPWYSIFQMLKRLEWQGELRRGYFVTGLSGVQFGSQAAVDLLAEVQQPVQADDTKPILVSTVDPALPFGGAVPWNLNGLNGIELQIVRAPANHLWFYHSRPVVYSENYGNRLWRLADFEAEETAQLTDALKIWLRLPAVLRPRRRLEIDQIDGTNAGSHELAVVFIQHGFEREGEKLVLWPSRI